ncbi:hypothetical protein [Chitinophaga agri]|uniref:Late embryogenesis abundant protein LEA-2 subgroup domain-containing protein n=1 Tax=Chitinophaga agri TaxID=2703787 RepID=A0A6B9ZJN6_9BACT|nr:hypothetical protein [Chitinophaga agri]QHS60823.1 hypothetical protein GWR21_14825 [Chitinophaga agri]
MTTSKFLAGAFIIGGAVAGGSYLYNMRRASVQLEIIPKAYVHSLSWTALTLRIDALLKNPTRASFKVKFPYIRITYEGSLLGSSQVVDKDIQIPSFGQVVIDSMMVELPVISIASGAYSIIKALFDKKPVKLSATVITTIDLGWSRIPYNSSTDITLKK